MVAKSHFWIATTANEKGLSVKGTQSWRTRGKWGDHHCPVCSTCTHIPITTMSHTCRSPTWQATHCTVWAIVWAGSTYIPQWPLRFSPVDITPCVSLCLASDNVQHKLQRWPLINIRTKEKKETQGKPKKENISHLRQMIRMICSRGMILIFQGRHVPDLYDLGHVAGWAV